MLYCDTCDTTSDDTAVTFVKKNMPPHIHRGGATDGIFNFLEQGKKTPPFGTRYCTGIKYSYNVRLSDNTSTSFITSTGKMAEVSLYYIIIGSELYPYFYKITKYKWCL